MAPRPVSLYQQQPEGLSLDSVFRFYCHAGLDCFNRCCRTPTIILSPYDLLRLKTCLGLTSGEFLRRYTLMGAEEQSNLPLVFVDAFRPEPNGCPFLGPHGCTVYAHRPAACRLFPITMGSQLTQEGVVDHYFCRRLDYCRGFDADVEWTVASWQANQGFPEFHRGRQEWLEILLRAGLLGPVADRVRDRVAAVAYDLDRFRQEILEPGFQAPHGLDGPQPAQLRTDDLALLRFSYGYLRSLLFAAG